MKNNEEFFVSNEELWRFNVNKVKQYIDENHKKPSRQDTNINVKKLGNWICDQQKKYKNKTEIMKNEEIYNECSLFIENYK